MSQIDETSTETGTEQEPAEAVLRFREQADGRKVARLPGGKVVLVEISALDRVGDGERWRVRLRHRDTFAIADPLDPAPDGLNPLLNAETAAELRGMAERSAAASPEAAGEEPEAEPRPPEAPTVPAPPEPRVEPATAAPLSPDRVVAASDRVAFFIDGANMDGACRDAGYFVDYRKAREFFLASGTFYAAFFYIADLTSSDSLQQRFLDFLSHAGYIVRRKPVKVIEDTDTGERIFKGNLDTEIVLDMVNTAENYDLAFLFSGDSDFERAVELLRSRGKRVYVVTSKRSLSRELAYVADKPVFLIEEFREALRREDRR